MLHRDDTFHFEAMRVLGSARYFGADVAEVLQTVEAIAPGDFEGWCTHFKALADRLRRRAARTGRAHCVSFRDAMFHAAGYYRAADFFLHGNDADPRICSLWKAQKECFDLAIAVLPNPGERITIQADGFRVPAIFYRADQSRGPRPTLLMCNGYDGSQEEMLHTNGFAALERGLNVVTFEGPGQPTTRREQGLGFIPEWERVVSPVLDFCMQQPEIDSARIGLLGYSMGALLAARAAAFDRRIAAVLCVDGIYDLYSAFKHSLPEALSSLFEQGAEEPFNRAIEKAMQGSTKMRWAIGQGLWSFKVASPFALLVAARQWSLKGVVDRITAPTLVCGAGNDRFFQGQPELLASALGDRARYYEFTDADAAGEHCHVGAGVFMNQVVMDWFEDLVHRLDREDNLPSGAHLVPAGWWSHISATASPVLLPGVNPTIATDESSFVADRNTTCAP
jgi:pimeloyl-ACP methyl ester carboxylesterase